MNKQILDEYGSNDDEAKILGEGVSKLLNLTTLNLYFM